MSSQTITIENLPRQSTRFVGRTANIQGILQRLREPDCRLLTLVGIGGIGKTRLATESIQHFTPSDFQHGVVYIPLAPLTVADSIVTTMINALGIVVNGDASLEAELINFLKQRNVLLVMDNFEHVLDRVDLVANILSQTSGVKVLATSREILNLSMEHIWHVTGMAFPEGDNPDDINQYDALNLFIERATQVQRNFAPGDEQGNIIRICQLVDGLPLGIELSASWLKTLSTGDIIRQIETGLDILASRARDANPRHQSIRAVFDHSWQLLTPDEQTVFPRLSVFRGGFTLDAAKQVAGASFVILSGLIEKSMIRLDDNGRYDIHELLRQYGEEQLSDAKEVESYLNTHADYFGSFMRDCFIDIQGRDQVEGLDKIATDFDNVIKAWHRAIEINNYNILDAMIHPFYYYSEIRWTHATTNRLYKHAVNQLKLQNQKNRHPIYNLLLAVYWLSWRQHFAIEPPETAWQDLETSIAFAKDIGDDLTMMQCHFTRGLLYQVTYKKEQALQELKQARDIAHRLKETFFEIQILGPMDYLYSQFGNNQEISRTLRHLSENTGALFNYGLTYGYQSFYERAKFDLPAAEECIKTAIIYFRMVKNVRLTGAITFQRGYLWTVRGDFDLGEKYLIEGERITVQHNFPWNHSKLYTARLVIDLVRGNSDKAYQHKQSATEYIHRSSPDGIALYHMGQAMYEVSRQRYEACLPHLIKALSLDMPFTDHIKASALILTAFLYVDVGNISQAAELLGLAQGQLGKYTIWFNDWRRLHQLQADLKHDLGEEAYQSAWEHGQKQDFQETLENVIAKLQTSDPKKPTPQPLIEPLTNRELEVLNLLAAGYSNKKIAGELIVTVGTVKAHVHNICQKLNVNSRLQAVNEARKLNLI